MHHIAKRQKNGCIYIFNNLPAGKWIVVLDLWHYALSQSLDNGYYITTRTIIVPDLAYAPLSITEEDTIVKKNILLDFTKRIDLIGTSMFRKIINLGEISDWDNPPKLPEIVIT